MRGMHCLNTWSNTQALVAKSSAESELYALVRASCEALGSQTLMAELGEVVTVRIHVDATAAEAIAERNGLDKLRHIDVNVLWIQDQEARDKLPLFKVCGKLNPADLMTKHLDAALARTHLTALNIEFRNGRAEAAAQLYSTTGDCLMMRRRNGGDGGDGGRGDEERRGGGNGGRSYHIRTQCSIALTRSPVREHIL